MDTGFICNRDVVIVGPEETIPQAARLMRQHHVGCLVVCDEGRAARRPIGILTDRDIAVNVVARTPDAVSARRVAEVMTTDILTARDSDPLPSTLKRMRQGGVRRMPIVDSSGALVGILALDDVIELLVEQLDDLVALIDVEQRDERHRLDPGYPPL